MLRWFTNLLKLALVALGLSLCVFDSNQPPWANVVSNYGVQSLLEVLNDPGIELITISCGTIYFATSIFLRFRVHGKHILRPGNPDLWLATTLGLALLGLFLDDFHADTVREVLRLLIGMLLGRAGALWSATRICWKIGQSNPVRLIMGALVTLMFLASLPKNQSKTFQYHEQMRWAGSWGDPNIFGLLMGVGIVLATGIIASDWWFLGVTPSLSGSFPPLCTRQPGATWITTARLFKLFLLAGVTACMGFALLKSYSRGASLGAFCGMVYFLNFVSKHAGSRVNSKGESGIFSGGLLLARLLGWLHQYRFPLLIMLLSAVVLAFWHLHDTKIILVRRILSIANVNDFSWRNRMEAWHGAMQMMADRPFFGWGRSQVQSAFAGFYCRPKVADSVAINLNDYLMLGATFGSLALVSFSAYVWLSLMPIHTNEGRKVKNVNFGTERAVFIETGVLKCACRAAAIVLLVGFWFDGGLFKMATAVPFWILLELGRRE